MSRLVIFDGLISDLFNKEQLKSHWSPKIGEIFDQSQSLRHYSRQSSESALHKFTREFFFHTRKAL